ncbi:MAG TPA: type IVB secretion system protein IcmH/DotU [Blastocatellia bacterium]|jgi:type VI secretion system protein ImpK|nr:type IVB secretion system protein IcmH/DotU [Blastocatellia bacterium]
MQSAIAERAIVSGGRTRLDADLVGLATPVFDLIMQIRANLVRPSNDLRRTIDEMLKQVEQGAIAIGYKDAQVQAGKFALAALADETVLTADFPLRDEWEKYPLQLEYFGEHLAGVKFFERLEELMKDAESNADVIEVYYVCMLIGYKGKYKIYLEDQLRIVVQAVADCLRRVNRLRAAPLSPHWKVTDQPETVTDHGLPRWAKISGGVGLALAFFIFFVFHFWISNNLNAAIQDLLR